ncbi:MAG TPA: rod shape-determining protein RodA [Bryobacterales bacterium]|jgi:rod shape determining protein RodA|nr:rod shape-determining protein RodA [Bryobacterales bacterium]
MRHSIRDLDWTLLGFVLAIATLGVLQIYSATRNTIWQGAQNRQIAYIIVGVFLMWLISQVDYHVLLERGPVLYLISIVGLIGIYIVGEVRKGSRRWIPLFGGFNFQVSEFVKLVLILLVARYFSQLNRETVSGVDLLKIGGLVGVPMLLVMKQPDLGTALTYLPIAAGGVLLAGVRWKHLAIVVILGALVLPAGWHFLKPYQKERLVTFVDPNRDPRGSGYQLIQSRIAVGAGGLWGKGIAKGSQTQLRFLPVPHTDFIFSAFAEEHGFTGVLLALALYFVVLMRIIYDAQTAADRAGTYICVCVCVLLLFHLLVNVGMVIGRMPVTGIPLPLMSYGGSSMFAVFLMLGLVNNVWLRRFVN